MPQPLKNNKNSKNRKTIALALSGCSGRAIAYIGLLEVFEENNIPVDMIAACSSGAIVACAYASGKLQALKEKAFSMTVKELFGLFEPSFKGGLFSLDKLDSIYSQFLSAPNLEQLNIPVAIVASDLVEGKEVVFSMGEVLRAIKASCSMPGVFEPVIWGGKVLVDGGLFSIVPVEAAKIFGADIVIGIDMAESRNLHGNIYRMRKAYNFIKWPFNKLMEFPGNVKDFMFGKADTIEYTTIDDIKIPDLMSVLTRAIDYAIEERKKGEFFNCDMIIRPEVLEYKKLSTVDFEKIYQEGRAAALKALPQIQELLAVKIK